MDAFALFRSPVFVFPEAGTETPDPSLVSLLTHEAATTPSRGVSCHGGWHSPPDLAQRDDPRLQDVARRILAGCRVTFQQVATAEGHDVRELPLQYSLTMWAMVLQRGGYAVLHDHPEAHWSVAYYVDAGEADPDGSSGLLCFVDPRRVPPDVAGVQLYPPTFTVRPRTGTLVVFPGWLQHYVHPYTGNRPRIVISANVRMTAGR